MATIGTGVLTLVDWAKRLDPDGSIAVIGELLSQSNRILDDMPFIEGNLPVGHRSVQRTGLPTVAWRMLSQGVAPSKSTTAQITDECGMLEAWCEVDCKLAELNGNTAAFRLSEAKAFIEAMNQEMAGTVFYGNSGVNPEEFLGLSPRYSSTTAASGQNIILGGGAAPSVDFSSVWLVGWSPETVFGIFPKGSKAGLEHEDLGRQVVEVTAGYPGNRMMAYRDRWGWACGLVVKDWRYAVRIPNVDISNLVAGTGLDLTEAMIKAIHRIPDLGMCSPVFYMNRSVYQYLDIQRRGDVLTGGGLSYQNVDGILVPTFRGIPVKICDALTEAEDLVA